MLNIQFNIQGDAGDKLLELQARGVVAALYAIYGDKVLPVPAALTVTHRVGDVSVTATGGVKAVRDFTAPSAVEPDAAAAFEGNTAEYLAVHADEPDAAAAFGAAIDRDAERQAAANVERDKNGIPWDARIHASTKTKNADGTWTRRRNTPDETFNAVMHELRGANTTRTMEAAGALVPPPPPSTVPAPPTASPAPSPTPAAAVASSTVPGAVSFPDVMRKITSAQAAGKVTPDQVTNLLVSIGANPPSVSSLAKDASLIPGFVMLLDDHLTMQG